MLSSCFKVHKLIVNSPIVTFMRVVVIDVVILLRSLRLLFPLVISFSLCFFLFRSPISHVSFFYSVRIFIYPNLIFIIIVKKKVSEYPHCMYIKIWILLVKNLSIFFRIEISISKYMIFHHERNGEDLIEEKISRIVLFQKRRTCWQN